MRFFSTFASVALAAFAAVAHAQVPTKGNAIIAPPLGAEIEAGQSYTIKWINVVGGPVTLSIMTGDENKLSTAYTIVEDAPNTGSYTWTVPDDVPAGTDYSIRISYDNNSNNYNYSDRFVLNSDAPPATITSRAATTTATSAATTETETESESTSTEEVTSTATEAQTTVTSSDVSSTTLRSSTSTRRTSTSAPTPTESQGAPPSAGNSNLSSPLAVVMAVLAAALFLQ